MELPEAFAKEFEGYEWLVESPVRPPLAPHYENCYKIVLRKNGIQKEMYIERMMYKGANDERFKWVVYQSFRMLKNSFEKLIDWSDEE